MHGYIPANYIALGLILTYFPFVDIPGYSSYEIKFRLRMPERLEKPGKHLTYISAVEKVSEGTGGIIVRTGVMFTIVVEIPYPGKYAEITRFDVPNVKLNQPVNFEIEVRNLGTENTTVSGIIDIFDVGKNKVGTVETESRFVVTKGSTLLRAVWDTKGIDPGNYIAVANIDYGGSKTVNSTRRFKIGYLHIDINNIVYNDSMVGEITKMLVMVQSFWNDEVTNVYATLELIDENGEIKMKSKSPSVDIKPWRKHTLEIYLDTHGLPPGEYRGKVILHYGENGKTTTREIKINILQPFTWILYLLGVIIIIGIVSGIFSYKKLKGRGRK